MVDTLLCEEVFHSPAMRTPNLTEREYQDRIPQFCRAYKDRAILGHKRVIQNMLKLENFYVPNSVHYHNLQDEIKIHMRKIVVEWMLDVCIDQRCHVDVFLLATNIMDRFLSTIRLRKKQFQLLGACSIFLASKMMESNPISAVTLVKYTADTYDRDELLSMELLILSRLQWDLTAITAYDYLDHLLDVLQNPPVQTHDQEVLQDPAHFESLRRQSERLITLCNTDPQFMSVPPSIVASAALTSAMQQDFESQPPMGPLVNLNDLVDRLRRYTNIELDSLRQCIDQIEELFISGANPGHESNSPISKDRSRLGESRLQGPSRGRQDPSISSDSLYYSSPDHSHATSLSRPSPSKTPTSGNQLTTSSSTLSSSRRTTDSTTSGTTNPLNAAFSPPCVSNEPPLLNPEGRRGSFSQKAEQDLEEQAMEKDQVQGGENDLPA